MRTFSTFAVYILIACGALVVAGCSGGKQSSSQPSTANEPTQERSPKSVDAIIANTYAVKSIVDERFSPRQYTDLKPSHVTDHSRFPDAWRDPNDVNRIVSPYDDWEDIYLESYDFLHHNDAFALSVGSIPSQACEPLVRGLAERGDFAYLWLDSTQVHAKEARMDRLISLCRERELPASKWRGKDIQFQLVFYPSLTQGEIKDVANGIVTINKLVLGLHIKEKDFSQFSATKVASHKDFPSKWKVADGKTSAMSGPFGDRSLRLSRMSEHENNDTVVILVADVPGAICSDLLTSLQGATPNARAVVFGYDIKSAKSISETCDPLTRADDIFDLEIYILHPNVTPLYSIMD